MKCALIQTSYFLQNLLQNLLCIIICIYYINEPATFKNQNAKEQNRLTFCTTKSLHYWTVFSSNWTEILRKFSRNLNRKAPWPVISVTKHNSTCFPVSGYSYNVCQESTTVWLLFNCNFSYLLSNVKAFHTWICNH